MSRLLLSFLMGSLAGLIGCATKEAARPVASSPADADIRSIDFRNFDYPKIPGFMATEIHLRNGVQRNLFRGHNPDAEPDSPANGEAGLSQVLYNYNDQGEPIAFVILSVSGGGSGTVSEIFLYKPVDHKPKLLWSFESGDRADGGLRSIYFESGSGNLVLELYEEGPDDPLCCASHFSRHFYDGRKDKPIELGSDDWIPLPKQPRRANAQSDR